MDELLQGAHAALAARQADAGDLPARDLFVVAQFLVPIDAHVACGCLVAAGVPAVVADDQLVQTNLLWAPALGGVRIRAPAAYLQQAKAVLAALARGDYALADDADVGPAPV